MGTKANPAKYDCYANALPDEPMFILLARDPSAPWLVDLWATEREGAIANEFKPQSDTAMVIEARECAANMRMWRKANNGKWRKAAPASPVAGDDAATVERSLTFADLRLANESRCAQWHGLSDWTVMEWACAMAGEAGEACNVAKKIKRIETGIAKNPAEIGADLTPDLAEECADVMIYLDLLCASRGIDLAAAVVAKFNSVSKRYDFPQRLSAASPIARTGGISDISDADFEKALNCAHSQYEGYVRRCEVGLEEKRRNALSDALSHAIGILQMRQIARMEERVEKLERQIKLAKGHLHAVHAVDKATFLKGAIGAALDCLSDAAIEAARTEERG